MLTQQLLAFSRKQILGPMVVDLNVIVPKTMKLVRRLIGKNITLTVCLNSNLGQVSVDPGQIEQVIMNLTVNA
jgi:signal transduction histidine kinase